MSRRSIGNVIESVIPQSMAKVDPPAPFDFAASMARVEHIVEPFNARDREVRRRLDERWERLLADPYSTLSGEAPREADEALDKIRQERSKATRQYHASQESALRAEERRLIEAARTATAAAVAAHEALRTFQQQDDQFAGVCGVETRRPRFADPGITDDLFRLWCHRIDRIFLNPAPPSAPRVRASAAYALDLSGLV